MSARGHFVFPIDAKNHKVLVILDLNGYGEYKFDWCICDGGGGAKNIIPRKFDIITYFTGTLTT